MAHTVARVVSILLAPAYIAAFGCSSGSSERNRPIYLIDHLEHAEGTFNQKQFLSFRKNASLSLSITFDGETRLSLAPPLPSRFAFDVRIPSNPVLRFAIAMSPLGDSKVWPPVEFRVLADTEGEEEPLFTETLNRTQARRWLDREIDLAPWEGRRLRLILETRVRRPRERVVWTARRVMPLWGNPVLSSKTYRGDKPSLILISIDCLRADHVGVYGYHRATTPHIDALAEDGSTFEAAISTSSWTLPTHLSMLTGLLPSFHGVREQQKLSRAVPYLPELLSQTGYQVDGVASWHFTSQQFGFDRGFHTYRLLVGRRADGVVDAALDLVRRAEGRNQFLFVHLIDPHWPYLPPKSWLERFGPRPRDISDLLEKVFDGDTPSDQDEIEQVIHLYDAEIAYADEQVGRLVDELKSRDLYDDALIIVTADHGEAFYEHGHWQHTVSLYDEVIRIPLIVKWPGSSRKARVKMPVSQIDIFPTILRAAGLDPPATGALTLSEQQSIAPISGRSVISELTSARGRPPPGCRGTQPPPGNCIKLAIRLETLKYIATVAEEDGELELVQQELYDIANDPWEHNDLSQIETAATDSFLKRVRAFVRMAKTQAASGEQVILDETATEQLRSLGYIH
jgi:arylsulfatase A-like enzyme